MTDEKTMIVRINEIEFKRELYPRKKNFTDDRIVTRYSIARKMGEKFPPIVVTKREGKYILVDGLHRIMSYRTNFEKANTLKSQGGHIKAIVYSNLSDKEILTKAIELNQKHGNQLDYDDLIYCGEKLEKYGYSIESISSIIKVMPSSITIAFSKKNKLITTHSGKPVVLSQRITEKIVCPTCHGSGSIPK